MKKTLLLAFLTTFSINAQTITDYVTGQGVPTGIAFDGSGNLYVADYNAYKVTKITPSLTQSNFAAVNASPQQITFDASGNLWIAGSGNFGNEIAKVTPAGIVTSYPATGSPYGIAIDAAGNVYYSEANSGDIKKRTVAGTTSTFATGFTTPNGLAFDKAGNLIVADKIDGAIKKITPSGVVSIMISGMNSPANLVYASNGDLYISTGSQNRIFRFPAGGVDGDQTLFFRFNVDYDTPSQMAIYNGALYVSTGSSTHKIVKITDPFLGLEDINNPANNKLVIYPNPATNFLHIENAVNPEIIQLFDITGRLVKSFKSSEIKDNQIVLPNLTSGTYVLKVDDVSKKVIIK
ncbi:T9SS type A sorting domain-containing protein [Flavobacterium limnophilum]|uniref:T9SS type A sorting domain-containing protein n=1 Tax=Flavobacterium limnophilum TaxID=3003262 RepID=UPI0024829E78|nr:T9SS type A sorting domain-containing protein [Flavobacterium limnophilum]